MLPLEAYKEFLLRINKNDTNKNINVPKGEFILLFNEQRLFWLDKFINDNIGTDLIEDIAEMYEPDTELVKLEDKDTLSSFTLPTDFFKKASVYCIVSKGDCTDVVMVAWDFKPKNKNINLQNSNEGPSFEYQETDYSLAGQKLLLYKTDFNIDKAYLSYYRTPIAMDIAGYKRLDGTTSTDVVTDLSDFNISQILDRCATITLGRYQNAEGTQIAAALEAKGGK